MYHFRYYYRGRKVFIPTAADIPTKYWPGRAHATAVQTLLDHIDPWEEGQDPIESAVIEGFSDWPLTVAAGQAPRIWAIHPGHKAHNPGLSPFIRLNRPPRTDMITVELAGSPKRPMIVRIYPGDYSPPLPWMNSASKADGGKAACLDFWRTHAYLVRDLRFLEGAGVTHNPPDWYKV